MRFLQKSKIKKPKCVSFIHSFIPPKFSSTVLYNSVRHAPVCRNTSLLKSLLKERDHSEMKTFERLNYCPHMQPITLIFPQSASTFHDCVSVSKICTSGDLHRTIHGSASHHPRTCITPSMDLHHTIRGHASEHLDLHQAIRTCIILP